MHTEINLGQQVYAIRVKKGLDKEINKYIFSILNLHLKFYKEKGVSSKEVEKQHHNRIQ